MADGTSSGQLKSNWAIIFRLLRFSWRYRWGCLKVLGLQVAFTACTLLVLALGGLGIDVIRHAVVVDSPEPLFPFGWKPPESWSALATASFVSIVILLVALVRGAFQFGVTVTSAKLIHHDVIVDLRTQVYEQLQRLSFRFFDQQTTSSVINRVTADVASLRLFVDGVLLQLVMVLLSLAFYLAYMLSIHVWLTMAALVTTPLLWTASALFTSVVRPAYDRNRELVDEMVSRLTENIQGIQVVKGFAREESEKQKFNHASRAVCDQMRWIFWRVSIYAPTMTFLTQINLCVLLIYGGYLVMTNQLPLGTGLVVFAGLLQQFSAQVTNIAGIANSIQQSLSGARRVFEILDMDVEISTPTQPVAPNEIRGELAFENVSFSYQSGEPVLENISFQVTPGRCLAVLGATGAGKSTLLSMIPRFYDPTGGSITVDGYDLRQLELHQLRRNIGVVFQESFLFSNTVKANISFGHPDATDEQIRRAAITAQAHEFIVELPDGYDTVLGEFGVDLSGGQRQRLALARALLLEPPILLLDDPTAAIDPDTEDEILAAMESAMRGRTTLIVAHRLSTLRRADEVIVLEHGRIVQHGTHAELMGEDGHYREAALVQAGAV